MKFPHLFYCSVLHGQNLIGYNSGEIRKYMKENKKELNFDNVKNEYFKYLKYPDNSGMTILFFPGSDSVCNSIRIICDRHSRLLNIKEFDTLYRKRKHMDRFA